MVKFQPTHFFILTTQGEMILTGLLINTNDKEDATDNLELTEEDLLLASTVIFSFSLTDKMWRALLSLHKHIPSPNFQQWNLTLKRSKKSSGTTAGSRTSSFLLDASSSSNPSARLIIADWSLMTSLKAKAMGSLSIFSVPRVGKTFSA